MGVQVRKAEPDEALNPVTEKEKPSGELGYMAELLRTPTLSALETILYRSRFSAKHTPRIVLCDFRKRRPWIFRFVAFTDIVARAFFVIFAITVLTRGLDIQPVDKMLSVAQVLVDFYKINFKNE